MSSKRIRVGAIGTAGLAAAAAVAILFSACQPTGPGPTRELTSLPAPSTEHWVPAGPGATAPVPTPSALPSLITVGRPSIRVPILMYHYIRVVNDPRDSLGFNLSVTPDSFRTQMQWLDANSYHTVDFNDLRAYFAGQAPLPSRPVVLTFDDGYRDLYTEAYPVLHMHGFKAVAYIVSGFVGSPQSVNREQVLEMDAHGIQIASHTVRHLDLTKVGRDSLRQELVDSRQDLEQLTGHPVLDFCYPAGKYSAGVARAVVEAGYQTATTTEPGTQHSAHDRHTWTRVRVHGGASLAAFISSLGPEEPAVTQSAAPAAGLDQLRELRGRKLQPPI